MAAFPTTGQCAHIFRNSGSLTTPRSSHTSTVLADGKVLIAGGENSVSTAEIYDPATQVSSPTGSMHTSRTGHVATLLPNNKVLVTGGSFYTKAEIFDPATGTWTDTSPFLQLRSDHSATLLPNGKVLLAGGQHGSNTNGAELYDPETDTWTPTGSLNLARSKHTATLLQNGKVLVVGDGDISATAKSAELYDPATGLWTITGEPSAGRTLHTATLLANGKVLVAGNYHGQDAETAELYDPSTGQWTATGRLGKQRYLHSAILLPDQTVLVFGGFSTSNEMVFYSEIYHPDPETWTAADPIIIARYRHTANLLPDGRVFIAGGRTTHSAASLSQTETYSPSGWSWATTAPMANKRESPTATLLNDGKVLVTGGRSDDTPNESFKYGNQSTCEIYDPNLGSWTTTGTMAAIRSNHSTVLLADGRVFVVGGETAQAEIYNPVTETWSPAGSFSASITSMTATLLKNGKILVAGGNNGTSSVSTSKLFDPATNKWSITGFLINRRESHTATLLADGRVLVVGGFVDKSGYSGVHACEIYNPQTGAWTETTSGSVTRISHSAALLPSGKVLIVGGRDEQGLRIASSELYDPSTTSWSESGPSIRSSLGHITVPLADGRVLVAGGFEFRMGNVPEGTAGTEIYDEKTGVWEGTPPLTTARALFAATSLADGRVIAVGGLGRQDLDVAGYKWGFNSSAEIYDPLLPLIQLEQPATNHIPAQGTKDFGKQTLDSETSRQFTLRNTGTADLTGLGITIDGVDAASFSVTTAPSATEAAPGAHVVFTVSFAPVAIGTKTATLHVSNNAYPFSIQLQGCSYIPAPEITVFHPAKTELKDQKFKKSFGTVKVGKAGEAKTFNIKNTGTANLTKLAITKDGNHKADFLIEPLEKSTLAPGASTKLKVIFKPTVKGTRNAAIHIKSNDANESPFDISVTGMGAKP